MSNYETNVKVNITGIGDLDKLEQRFGELKNVPIKLNVENGNIKALLTDLKAVQSSVKSIGNMKIGTSGGGGNNLSSIKKQLASIPSAKVKMNADTSGLQKSKTDFQMLKNLANEIGQKKIKLAGLDISKNANQFKELSSQVKKLESDYSVLNKSLGSSLSTEQVGKLNNILGKTDDKISEIKAKTKDMGTSLSGSAKPFNTLDAETASNKTLTWLNKNTRAMKDYGEALKSVAARQRSATSKAELASANKEYRNIISQAELAGKTGNSFGSELKRAASQIGQFVGIYGVIQQGVQVVKQMASELLNVDTAMMNLQMSTGKNAKQTEQLMSTYQKMGKELKATGTDVAASATEWLKQGKSQDDSKTLAKDSIVLSKIGDLSSTDSTKYLTSAMKGYKVSVEDTIGIVDKLSAVDLVSATSVGGLAEGMSEVANNANLAGVSMDKLLGYLATVGEVMQEGMSSVGHSFSTIFSRMGNIKLSRLKDYQNSGEDLSNVETVLRGQGINLRDETDSFRNFGEVIDDVAGNWSSYSEVSQRAIASAFAGKNQMEEFLVLMENYDKAQKYEQTSLNSSGQSMEKFSAYQESMTGKLEGFKNQFQELSTVTLNSDFLKGGIDAGAGFLNILTQIMDVGATLPAIVASIAGIFVSKNGLGKRKIKLVVYNTPLHKVA